jgi:hypothetical protein
LLFHAVLVIFRPAELLLFFLTIIGYLCPMMVRYNCAMRIRIYTENAGKRLHAGAKRNFCGPERPMKIGPGRGCQEEDNQQPAGGKAETCHPPAKVLPAPARSMAALFGCPADFAVLLATHLW